MSFGERDMTAVFLSVNAKTHNSMNEFEKQMNHLRIQFCKDRDLITKDARRRVGHLNNAIAKATYPDVRDALRAERARVYEAMRQSHKYSRLCYRQQLEALQDKYRIHLDQNLSKSQIRRVVAAICDSAEADGENSIIVSFGDNRHATISFD